MKPFQPDSAAAMPLPSAVERLNAVQVSALHFEGALAALGRLPVQLRDAPAAQALTLLAYAADQGMSDEIAAAALHARAAALARWTRAHDPKRQSNAEAVIEAAARFPLAEGEDGIGFEPGGFQEMILFIEELPW